MIFKSAVAILPYLTLALSPFTAVAQDECASKGESCASDPCCDGLRCKNKNKKCIEVKKEFKLLKVIAGGQDEGYVSFSFHNILFNN